MLWYVYIVTEAMKPQKEFQMIIRSYNNLFFEHLFSELPYMELKGSYKQEMYCYKEQYDDAQESAERMFNILAEEWFCKERFENHEGRWAISESVMIQLKGCNVYLRNMRFHGQRDMAIALDFQEQFEEVYKKLK
jgi:hypothetical protein